MAHFKFKKSSNGPKVIEDNSHMHLVLVGDAALRPKSRPPDITNYRSPIYYPGELVDSFHNMSVGHSHYCGLLRCKSDTDPENLEGKRGFFNPQSRPPSGLQSRTPGGRPNTPASRPASAFNLPTAGVSRTNSTAGNLVGRPTSAYNRPHSAQRAASRASAWEMDTDIDLDHEPITDVLSRLDEYSQNFTPILLPANTECECSTEEHRLSSHQARVYHSGSDSSGSDEDEVGVTLEVLLKTFHQFEEKGHSAVRQKAMMTLVHSYISLEALTDQQYSKLNTYLTTSLSEVQEACLVLLKHCVKNSQNLGKCLHNKLLDFLYECLLNQQYKQMRKDALLLLETIFSNPEFKDSWYEMSVTKFLPKLISVVRGEFPLDIKYAACCVFRAFALYEEFIVYVTDEILPSVLLMRNASTKFKEVYVEILTSVLSHRDCIRTDLVDTSAIPVTASIIREGPCGPQCAALTLLSSLTTNDSGVAIVIGTNSLVPMILCCMKESHCRKVRQNATEVIRSLCNCRKLGLCKDLMLQLSSYLVPSLEQDSLTSLSQMAAPNPVTVTTAKPRFDEERQMWLGLEKFIDMTKTAIFREAKVETDDHGLVSAIHMKPCIDTNTVQLNLLAEAFQILQHVCLWPLDKSRLGFSANRVDLTTFTDDDKQRARLSKVNRGLTQAIWDKVGLVVTDLLLSYADKFCKVREESTKGRQSGCKKSNQTTSLEVIFETQEVNLITSLLELTLCSALCTCVAFPEIMPKLKEKPSKRRSKSPSKLKSASASQVLSENTADQTVESRLKSQSDTASGFATEEEKIWVKENQHLTSMQSKSNQDLALERSRAELRHKEACTERRLLRKCLYESDVFHSVCPFIMCDEENIQILVLQILRCLVQPLEERVAPKLSFGNNSQAGNNGRQRPQTAGAVPSAQKRMNIAFHRMSPELATLIKEALGHQMDEDKPKEKKVDERRKIKKVNIPGTHGLETIHERLQEFTETSKHSAEEAKKEPTESSATFTGCVKPVIDRCRPIAQQCREALVEGLGERLIMGIFTKSHKLKKYSVLLLHDFVQFGEVESHMSLSTYGCMPRLIDFLRVNEDNELLEIIGLIMVRMLVSSDNRLKQLFNRHGGPQLLLAMAQYTKGLLKQEVSNTLKTVSKVETVRKRPVSAPAGRMMNKERAPDIWDYIQARWQQEDQVTNVLRQWIVDDRKHRKK